MKKMIIFSMPLLFSLGCKIDGLESASPIEQKGFVVEHGPLKTDVEHIYGNFWITPQKESMACFSAYSSGYYYRLDLDLRGQVVRIVGESSAGQCIVNRAMTANEQTALMASFKNVEVCSYIKGENEMVACPAYMPSESYWLSNFGTTLLSLVPHVIPSCVGDLYPCRNEAFGKLSTAVKAVLKDDWQNCKSVTDFTY